MWRQGRRWQMAIASAGWFEAVDSTYLHTYYFNPSTGERLWERPVPKPALPPGWLEARDPGTGVPYYCNASTGE